MLCRSNAFWGTPVLLLALVGLAAPGGIEGQAFGPNPTFIAIPDEYPDLEGPVVVVRQAARNIILLRASEATPEALSVAFLVLRRLTERSPMRPGLAHMTPVTGFHLRTPLGAVRQARLDDMLTRLRSRPVAQIGNLGTGRFLALTPSEAGT